MTAADSALLTRFKSWLERPEWALPVLLFGVIWLHGGTIGLTDDEAYYWVLAQKPAFGYAFHPPAVAWIIALSQALTGWLLGHNSTLMVRLPAAFSVATVLGLALHWLKEAGAAPGRLWRGGWVLLSMAGLFSLSWMMVPDLPLLVGWMLAFTSCWKICFGRESRATGPWLAAGIALSLLSKYSGVFVVASAVLGLLLWGKAAARNRALRWAVAGTVVGALPPLLWNATHQWASILYQIRDRHDGASLSLTRYLRFWLIETFAVGPCLLAFAGVSLVRAMWPRGEMPMPLRVYRYTWLWAAPAALVFCTQPLWADFKPHWALVVWWPVALALAWRFAVTNRAAGFARPQMIYGLGLGVLVLLACQLPIGNEILFRLSGRDADPKLDVTNDLYGWKDLPAFLRAQPGNADLSMPVIGSRYQTAAQAYFALGPGHRVTMLPRDLKARDEWPEFGVADGSGPDWPRLRLPVFFVGDNRYDEGPGFLGASCGRVGRLRQERGPLVAKWIDVWRCETKVAIQ